MMRVRHFSQSRLFHPDQVQVRQEKLPAEIFRSTQSAKAAL
jgi:hypothetical protein